MNFNTKEYDKLEKELKENGCSNMMCVFLEKDENGVIMCDRSSHCDNVEKMLQGIPYECF